MQTTGPPAQGHTSSLDTRDAVAGKGKRKRRKRSTRATAIRRLRARSNETWSDIVQAYQPAGDSEKLPDLFADRRGQRAELAGLSEGTSVERVLDPEFGSHSASFVTPPQAPRPKQWRVKAKTS